MELPHRKPATDLDAIEKRSIGKGVFRKCDGCGATLTVEVFAENFDVCPECQQHHKLNGEGWRDLLLDGGKLEEWDEHLSTADPLGFTDGKPYADRILSAQK